MKKILFAAFALVSMLMATSCSNDEIEVVKEGKKHNLTVQVSTKELYDRFEWSDKIRDEQLRTGTGIIGVMTLVYDAAGNLVKQAEEHTSSFNNVTTTLALQEGTYTVVAVETLLSPDLDNKSKAWEVVEEDKLSTVKLKLKDDEGHVPVECIIGVGTQMVTVTGQSSITMVAEPVGCRINFLPFNFKNARMLHSGSVENVVETALATLDFIESYSLNPQLAAAQRFNKGLTGDGYAHFFCNLAAEKSDDYYSFDYIVSSELELRYMFQTEDMSATSYFTGGTNVRKVSLENGKVYYAGVYYFSEDYVPATFFGSSYSELQSWKSQCDENLKSLNGGTTPSTPSGSLYQLPYTSWTPGTVSAVRSYCNGLGLKLLTDLEAQDDGTYNITYLDENNHSAGYLYEFKTATSGLTDVYVVLNSSFFKLDDVKAELVNEGYIFRNENDGNFFYSKSDGSTGVLLYQLNNSFVANYYDPKAYTSSARKTRLCGEEIVKKLPAMPGLHRFGGSVMVQKDASAIKTFNIQENKLR